MIFTIGGRGCLCQWQIRGWGYVRIGATQPSGTFGFQRLGIESLFGLVRL